MDGVEGSRSGVAVALGLAAAALMLVSYAVVVALDVPVLTDDRPTLGAASVGAAVAGVGLLTVDALVPIPSSGVMIALGAAFGAVPGALLSVTGSIWAALVGWWIGRRGEDRYALLAGADRARRLPGTLERGGLMAVIASRPIPVLAETVTIMAGASGMPGRRLALGAAIGSIPPAVAYGVVGAAASEAEVALPVVVAVMVLGGGAWLLTSRRRVTTS